MRCIFSFTFRGNAIILILFICLFLFGCKKSDNGPSVSKLEGNWICSGQYQTSQYIVFVNDSPKYAIDTSLLLTDTLKITLSNLDSNITVEDLNSADNGYFPIIFSGVYSLFGKNSDYYTYWNNYDFYGSQQVEINILYYYKENRVHFEYTDPSGNNNNAILISSKKY